MSTANEEIEMLTDILDKFENGELEVGSSTRKCYLCEEHKQKNIITWVHDHELRGHCTLRRIGKQGTRDLLIRMGK